MSTDRLGDHRRQSAEDLYQLGRTAARNGDRAQAQTLLRQALEYNREHSDAWLWLAAVSDDAQEQKQCLEWSVAANPANAAARRGLAILTGRLKPQDLAPETHPTPASPPPAEPETAVVRRTFICRRCGGRLRFDPELVDLKCESCGQPEVVEEVPLGDAEQVLDFNLPTRRGHAWADAARRFTCGQCGAHTVLPAGQTSSQCPFCGSSALVAAPEDEALLEPQGLIPMGLDAAQAQAAVKNWLGRGSFAPDDLAQFARGRELRPAYVPFWTFNATLNARWSAEVQEGSGRSARWVARAGEHISFYTNQLQPGTKALPRDLLRRIEPFALDKLIVFKPEYLAGWPAAMYDFSLAEASLDARAAMLAQAKTELRFKAAPGRNIRNLEVGSGDFTGQTYKFVFLPLWIGAYAYRGKTYRILVNGQTAKVEGDQPLDPAKMILAAVAAALTLSLLALAAWYFLHP
jgi:DNA-directed RNA polymerase subunit RPC12/RpoP